MALSMDSRSSVSLPPAIQATGLLTFALAGFTPPLNTPAFLWTYGPPACALTVYQLIHCKVLKIWEGGRGCAHAVVKVFPHNPNLLLCAEGG